MTANPDPTAAEIFCARASGLAEAEIPAAVRDVLGD